MVFFHSCSSFPINLVCIIVFISFKANGVSGSQCNIEYTKRGCYHDPGSYGNNKDRPLPQLILNWRHKINWTLGWNQQLREMACRCAEIAKGRKYRYFGLQYYGECWSGVHSSALFNTGKSNQCWGFRPNYQTCVDKSATECIGQGNHNYIYEVHSCANDPCQNGGECYETNNGKVVCECPDDYAGRRCEIAIGGK